MELLEARTQVIDMGKRLLQTGLIARTWGNVSCRVNSGHFVITPSGRAYESLQPEEIVIINISDGEAWGDVRPSSEKGVHLEGYRRREDVNFIIHTHQPEASVLSALELDLSDDLPGVFGDTVYCADYGFPGTETLEKNVAAVMEKGHGNALLMAHHGTVCMAKTGEEALRVAVSLEMLASFHIRKAFERYLKRPMTMEDSIYEAILNDLGVVLPQTVHPLYRSERHGDDMDFYQGEQGECQRLSLNSPSLTEVHQVHQAIYAARPDIGAVTHSYAPSALAYSVLSRGLATYLDDFAQINGVVMNCASLNKDDIVAKLDTNHGVLVKDNGVLCCGKNLYDAEALVMVTEKNARSWLIGQLFPETPIKAIPPAECEKMRQFYLENYSKRF